MPKTTLDFRLFLLCKLIFLTFSLDINASIFKPSQDASLELEIDLELYELEKRVFQPQYNSLNGNGLLGVGWSMLATSTISRCSSTIPHLGAFINGEELDAFCLDGIVMEPQGPNHYLVSLPSGERKYAMRWGDCDDSCTFLVNDGKGENAFGEMRWYNNFDSDANPLNGIGVYPHNSKPLVWSLTNIQVGEEVISFDHKTNFITNNSLPYRATSRRVNPLTGEVTIVDIDFLYQTRSDNFVGSVDGHNIRLTDLLTEVQFMPRSDDSENAPSINKKQSIQFYYELSGKVKEKLITQIEHCQWKTVSGNKWQSCQRNTLYWTIANNVPTHSCERHWTLPYTNYLICDQQRHNYLALRLVDNGNQYNQLHIQHKTNPKNFDDTTNNIHYPLLSLDSISVSPKSQNAFTTHSQIIPFFVESVPPAVNNRWQFEWMQPSKEKFGRTTGFNLRRAVASNFGSPLEINTSWSQTAWGKMVDESTSVEENLEKDYSIRGRFQCQYSLVGANGHHPAFQPFVTQRSEEYRKYFFQSCRQNKNFTLNANFEMNLPNNVLVGGFEDLCETENIGEIDHNMAAYDGYLEFNSCDIIYSFLDLNISGPLANSNPIFFPPDELNIKSFGF